MKKFKLIEETQYMLTDETRSDKQLNAVDLNMLAILQFIKDGKASGSNWFNILIKHPKAKWDNDNYTSVEKYFDEFGVKTDYTTLNRSINKLQRLGYLEYKTGFYNSTTKTGMTPRITILKGTINIDGSINCSDIAIAKELNNFEDNSKLTNNNSETYSDIAITKEKEKYKEKENKSTIEHKCNTSNISTSIGETNPLFQVLVDCDDDNDNLQALLYLDQHFTNENVGYIKQWWRNKPDWLKNLDNFTTNRA